VDAATGSLGQGLSVGAGLAIGARMDNSPTRVYVLTGDGELAEGQVWEAAAFAAHYDLDNLRCHSAQAVGGSITTRSRGRWSGNVSRSARRRAKTRTVVVLAAACSAASSSSVALASSSSKSSAS
jgi:hypothetical protein